MKLCLISMEIFSWGKHGGYGRAPRLLGRELAVRGVEVSAVVPRRGEQRAVEDLDGIRVLGFPARAPWQAANLLRECDAAIYHSPGPWQALPSLRERGVDIYHSQEPSLASNFAQRVMPSLKHVLTVRDTRELK